MTNRIDILRHIVKPNLGTLTVGIIVSAVLWFMPEMFGSYDYMQNVDVLFMKQYVLWSYPMYAARILGFVFSIIIFLGLMQLALKLQILPTRSSMPLIIGLSIASVINYNQAFDESFFAIILFIFASQQLINMYHFEKQIVSGFNIIILMSIASLFEPQYVWLSLLFILGMIIFRIIKERVFLSIILGLVTVSILSVSMFWLLDSLNILTEYLKRFLDVSFYCNLEFKKSDIIFAIIILLIIILSLVNSIFSNRHFKLSVRLNFTFISWCFWFSVIWLFLFQNDLTNNIAVPMIFAILSLSLFFTSKNNNITNITFIIYTISIVSYRVLWCLGI